MKKIIFILVFILTATVISTYIFIPKTLIVSKVIYVESSDRIIYDYLLTNKNKMQWWPKNLGTAIKSSDSTSFSYNETSFKFFDPTFNSAELIISRGEDDFKGTIASYFEGKTNIKLVCKTTIKNDFNPLKRLANYFKAISIKKDITSVFESFGSFIIKEKNIYGLKIKRTIVKDTLLLTTNKSMNHYPSIEETYTLINKLEEFAKNNSAKITNSPMLNVIKTFEGNYNVTVAIPVDKTLEAKAGYFVNKMFPGNILETEIRGGKSNIDNGFLQLRNYIKDFKLTSPAMPFEMMITNRSLETDTTKWITKLYYPIF